MSLVVNMLSPAAREFLRGTTWSSAQCEPLTGDASVRKYFRLRQGGATAILMDASAIPHTVVPFVQIAQHLCHLGFSAPQILVQDRPMGFLLVEDFGDDTFARLLENHPEPVRFFALATDVLIALHRLDRAIPAGLRAYDSARMLTDLELYLEWCAPGASEEDEGEFREAWKEVLPLAHRVPTSLLLRDYHAANLMFLAKRAGHRQAGLLDFQDAYAGPVTYDLMSLLQDARRDVPDTIRQEMAARYLASFPALHPDDFHTSSAILGALRHTRVLGIFERLSRFESKHEYKQLHSPRVQGLLQAALRHPVLAKVKRWMDQHAG